MVISSPSKDQRPLKRLWITPLDSTQTVVKMTSLPQTGQKKKANFIQAWIDFQVKVEDVENYVITIEQATSPQLRRIAKAYQTFDKYLASIRVYSGIR